MQIQTKTFLLLVVAATAGCPANCGTTTETCASQVGDLSADIELDLVLRTSAGENLHAGDGALAPLLRAPQGGLVMFAGPRARNLNGCDVEVTATVEDPCSGAVLSQGTASISLVEDEEGYAVPAEPHFLRHFVHLPMCPSAAAVRNVNDEPYRLRLRIKDARGREAEVTRRVVPTCTQQDVTAFCQCACNANYDVNRQCAEQDAGHPFEGCDF